MPDVESFNNSRIVLDSVSSHSLSSASHNQNEIIAEEAKTNYWNINERLITSESADLAKRKSSGFNTL